MLRKGIYKVAEHSFSMEIDESSFLWKRIAFSYGPFEIREETDSGHIFSLSLIDEVIVKDAELVYSNRETVEPGFVIMDVYKNTDGHFFELRHFSSSQTNCRLFISSDFSEASVSLYGNHTEQWLIFNTAVDFCFLLSTSCRDTVLTHASSVIYKGKAYLFLGKSGTGKSTHSRMWLSALEDVILMNDDHPVIRLDNDGMPIAYGSPWSGKTPCYKNLSAPLGGIIRISRALHNKARRLAPVEAYASIMTSCSGMTWERDLADGRDRTMQGIVARTPCWVMECLPDEDAAKVCSATVTCL